MDTARTILLVDDDPTLRAVFATVLRRSGYSVLCAGGAEDALELLRTNSIAAILTDLHMPKMDGVALLAHIAAAGISIPAILMTGSGEHEAVHESTPGVDAVLVKPILRGTLLRTLERLLAQKKSGDSSPLE
jgi:CheY-like chemotaxis protein